MAAARTQGKRTQNGKPQAWSGMVKPDAREGQAGRAAFDIVLIERLNTTHPDTDPSRGA